MRSALERLVDFYRLQVRLIRTWRLGPAALARRLLLTTAVAFVSLGTTIVIVPGITVTNNLSVLAGVAVIVLLNILVRPVILAVCIPLGLVAVALVATALQVVVVLLLGQIVPGIHVRDLAAAVQGAVVFAVTNATIGWLILLGEDDSYFGHLVRLMIREHAATPRTDEPGVVMLQIDGLSHRVLTQEIRAGRVPTMSRWLRTGSHRLARWECQLPSQTSASQAGILLGSNDGIPAFRWYEKATGRLMVSNRPPDAAEIERRLATGDGLLRDGGSSIGNLISGEATEAILTTSRVTDPVAALGPTRSWFYFFVSPFAMSRAVFLTLGEAVKELWQARRQRVNEIEPRIDRGGVYPLLRAITNVLLRQVSVALVIERILAGVPVVYVDFVDYDEIAHHAGPERGEALDALDGLDQVLHTLERATQEAPRPYKFVVLSDHGQSLGATFRQRYGLSLEELIGRLTGGQTDTDERAQAGPDARRGAGRDVGSPDGQQPDVHAATGRAERWGPVNTLFSEITRGGGAVSRFVGRAVGDRRRDGYVELGGGSRLPEGSTGQRPPFVVCASGNLALVYLGIGRDRLTLEEIETSYPGLVESLARHEGIGFVLARSGRYGPLAIGGRGRVLLESGEVEGANPLAGFGPYAAEDLRRLDGMPNVGDLVLNSRLDPETEEVAAFEELVGSHGGLGGPQTEAFVLHPAEWHVPDGRIVGAPAVHRVLAGWLEQAGALRRPATTEPAATEPVATGLDRPSTPIGVG